MPPSFSLSILIQFTLFKIFLNDVICELIDILFCLFFITNDLLQFYLMILYVFQYVTLSICFVALSCLFKLCIVCSLLCFDFSKKLLCFNWLMLQEARAYADENGLFFIETSAKTAVNVNDIFYEIGAIVIWLFPYGHYILAWFLFIKFCSLYFILFWFFNLMSIFTRWE